MIVSDETARTLWYGLYGFMAYVVGFMQAMFILWWKSYKWGREDRRMQKLVDTRTRDTVYYSS